MCFLNVLSIRWFCLSISYCLRISHFRIWGCGYCLLFSYSILLSIGYSFLILPLMFVDVLFSGLALPCWLLVVCKANLFLLLLLLLVLIRINDYTSFQSNIFLLRVYYLSLKLFEIYLMRFIYRLRRCCSADITLDCRGRWLMAWIRLLWCSYCRLNSWLIRWFRLKLLTELIYRICLCS